MNEGYTAFQNSSATEVEFLYQQELEQSAVETKKLRTRRSSQSPKSDTFYLAIVSWNDAFHHFPLRRTYTALQFILAGNACPFVRSFLAELVGQ